MAPGEEGRQIEGENVITTSGSLLFVPYNPRGYLEVGRLVWTAASATVDTRRPLSSTPGPSLSYFARSATPCGSAVVDILR